MNMTISQAQAAIDYDRIKDVESTVHALYREAVDNDNHVPLFAFLRGESTDPLLRDIWDTIKDHVKPDTIAQLLTPEFWAKGWQYRWWTFIEIEDLVKYEYCKYPRTAMVDASNTNGYIDQHSADHYAAIEADSHEDDFYNLPPERQEKREARGER